MQVHITANTHYIPIPTQAVAVAHRQLMSYHQHCIMKPDITTSQKAMMA
jgi:hypothetical protein